MAQVTTHHLYVGIGLIGFSFSVILHPSHDIITAWIDSINAQLSITLAMTGSLSITFSHHVYAMPLYPYLGSDYPTMLCLFVHHMWIGGFLILGGGAHTSIFIIGNLRHVNIKLQVLNHRHLIIGHLIYVTIALGLHSFSLHIHNDTLQALSRREDMFTDNSIQLKPFLAIWVQS